MMNKITLKSRPVNVRIFLNKCYEQMFNIPRRGNLSMDDEKAYLVAQMYYLENLTQAEIAHRLNISRPQVSRLLSYARRKGMVQISIRPIHQSGAEDLSKRLKDALSLDDVVVANNTDDDEESILESISNTASDYISKVLKDGEIVGWGWGKTVYRTVTKLKRLKTFPSSLFVPLIGGAGQTVRYYQVNSIVEKASEIFGAKCMYLNAPAFFDDRKTLESFLRKGQIANVVNIWERIDVAIFGLGKPVYDSEILKSEMEPSLILELIRERAVGDILARFFDEDGKICSPRLNDLILGIKMDDLLKIPRRICLCGGYEKIKGMITAGKMGFYNVLITDHSTAESILERVC